MRTNRSKTTSRRQTGTGKLQRRKTESSPNRSAHDRVNDHDSYYDSVNI